MTQLRNRDTGQVRTSNEVEREIRQHTSAPAVIDFTQFNYDIVFQSPRPTFNPVTHFVREIAPEEVKGKFYQKYIVEALSQEQVDTNIANQKSSLISSVTSSTQQRLDTFANTRNYSNTDSISKYKDISDAEIALIPAEERPLVIKFRTECRYLAVATAQTWARLYLIMAEVEAGTRPTPSGYADIESELPELTWPVINT